MSDNININTQRESASNGIDWDEFLNMDMMDCAAEDDAAQTR